jgi:hypothetical protein
MTSLLLTWLGQTDLRALEEPESVGAGPVAQAVATDRFAKLEILSDWPAADTRRYVDWLRTRTDIPIEAHVVTLPSPRDFAAIYRRPARSLRTRYSARQMRPR